MNSVNLQYDPALKQTVSGIDPLSKKPSHSLVEDVVNAVVLQISSGKLRCGDKLPTEQQMMYAYGVSRTVIREALSRLQAAGLVQTQHGVGTFVLTSDDNQAEFKSGMVMVTFYDVLDMLELRIHLETKAVELAAARRAQEDLDLMAAMLDNFDEQIRRGGNAADTDIDFHLQIGKATGNQYFEEVYRFLGQNTIPSTRVKMSQYTNDPWEQYLMRINREHRSIYEAIVRQDGASGQAMMHIHLTNVRERLRKVLEIEEAQSTRK
ncbi:GntR family transcriptional regulator [Deltaproteobacteria bacterium]|nr:GntR family transcriptional regulator [Deltaproteobacteria bacterium]